MTKIMSEIDKQVARMGFDLIDLELQFQQAQQYIQQLEAQLAEKNARPKKERKPAPKA